MGRGLHGLNFPPVSKEGAHSLLISCLRCGAEWGEKSYYKSVSLYRNNRHIFLNYISNIKMELHN